MHPPKTRLQEKILLFFALSTLLMPLIAKASFVYEIPKEDNGRYYFRIQPGGTAHDYIYITNPGKEVTTLNLYGADAIQTAEGSFAAKTISEEQVNMGQWIKFAEPTVTIQPGEKKQVNFAVAIPVQATPGTYAGAIAIASAPSGSQQGGMGLQTVGRLIIKVLADIPGDKIFAYNWQSFSYLNGQGKKEHSFAMKFSNSGNTPVIINGEIRIFGSPEGDDASTQKEWEGQTQESPPENAQTDTDKDAKDTNIIPINNITIYKGDSITVPADWGKQPLYGSYKAVAKITFSEFDPITQEKKNPNTIIKEITFSVTPWNYIFIGIALLILAIATFVYKIVSFRALLKKYIPYKVASKDTLEKIATVRNAGWKKIAKINKIKAPYTIEEGQTILVPPLKKK
jgi:LysM repeat protein